MSRSPSLHEHTNPSTQRSKLDPCGAATLAIHIFALMTTQLNDSTKKAGLKEVLLLDSTNCLHFR